MADMAALLFLLGSVVGEVRPDSVSDLLAERCLSLGIDTDPDNPNAPHPSAENSQDLARAGASAWLDAQITSTDDSVGEPPAALQQFLSDRQGILTSVISLLEKRTPEPLVTDVAGPIPKFLPFVRLEKLLLVVALVEARNGNPIEAERALEASWSLGRAFASGTTLLCQLVSVSVERWQAGVLRKLRQAPFAWTSRISAGAPWTRMLDSLVEEGKWTDPTLVSPTMDPSVPLRVKALAALADGLRKVTPCELPDLTEKEIFRPAADVFRMEASDEARAYAFMYEEISLPNLLSSIRRAARLMVDRELTLKILELRLEKAASREGDWPTEFGNVGSSACPGVLYSYRSDGKSMQIRFDGAVNTPEGGVVLPLEFRSGAGLAAPLPTLTPSPTPTSAPTPTPEPESEDLDSSDSPEP